MADAKQREVRQNPKRPANGQLGAAVKAGSKSRGVAALLGCSMDQFCGHLEIHFLPGMSWENYGKTGWEIDHKKPCCSFDLLDISQRQKCFHYSNLQPLWAEDNQKKGKTLGKHRDF
jgi:hypothetical protein